MAGHLGEEKVMSQLKERLYWPGFTEAVRTWCRQCTICMCFQEDDNSEQKFKAELQTIKAGYPMQIVSVDIIWDLFRKLQKVVSMSTIYGSSSCMLIILRDVRNQEAITVSKKIEMFCRFSPPEQLHSDHDFRQSKNQE